MAVRHKVIKDKNKWYSDEDNKLLAVELEKMIKDNYPPPCTVTGLYKLVANSTSLHRYLSYRQLLNILHINPHLKSALQVNVSNYYDKAVHLIIEEAIIAGDVQTAKWYLQNFKDNNSVVSLEQSDNPQPMITQMPILNFNTTPEHALIEDHPTIDVTDDNK